MLFTAIMNKQRIFVYIVLAMIAVCTWIFSTPSKAETEFSEKVKIALRDVGNKLLLSEKDSTSLILPVVEISKAKYELSFQNPLQFEPNNMVFIMEQSFIQSQLPLAYLVEVIQCDDEQVAYSFLVTAQEESTIIPCNGRWLPKNCYKIQVRFTEKTVTFWNVSTVIYIFLFIIFIVMELFFFRKKPVATSIENDETFATIGSFYFYPTQNKLVKQATEINLSKKECELLQIFAANLNQVVTRDELTKKVWEDNGVIVGRSLDTYISKLRKKLKDDERIKITNVHGVGYKLELES
ncbi:winged helix-turn-helix domain-containing protein [Kordia algicida OT-1]|uniref:Two-component system response regulator n=1 Tax=Kordia algicida OT-1 TaxID=391587 RepID=A9DRB0_9FLAO|nr:winged helix-turn-helix domain-containing protein [Kordia algicida]EDP96767.1 two-component system response regulator [Kordia algicida OT-1]